MHLQKLAPLKSANVDTENIILYKRHIGKVILCTGRTGLCIYKVIRLRSISNSRFLVEVQFLAKNENKFKFALVKRLSEAELFSKFENHDYILFLSNLCLFLALRLIHHYPLFCSNLCFLAPKLIHDRLLFGPIFCLF